MPEEVIKPCGHCGCYPLRDFVIYQDRRWCSEHLQMALDEMNMYLEDMEAAGLINMDEMGE